MTRRRERGGTTAETWGRCPWGRGRVRGHRGRQGRRRPRGGTRSWMCLGAGLCGALVPAARAVPALITPRPGRALDAPCSCRRPRGPPRAPFRPCSLLGKPPTSEASLGTVPGARAAGPKRRRASPWEAGRRARPPVRASESPDWAAFTWTWIVREAEAGLGRQRSSRRGTGQESAASGPSTTGWPGKVSPPRLENRELVKNTLKPKSRGIF